MFVGFFYCRQKTAFEVRVSDWSSYVCSSDLRGWCLISFLTALRQQNRQSCIHKMVAERTSTIQSAWPLLRRFAANIGSFTREIDTETASSFPSSRPYSLAYAKCSAAARLRSEESRVGKECVITCRFRGLPYH